MGVGARAGAGACAQLGTYSQRKESTSSPVSLASAHH